MIGSLFGDTIVFEQWGKTHTYDNVEFIKAENGKVYFKIYGDESSRYCNKVLEFNDIDGNPIEYDCSIVFEKPKNNLTKLTTTNKTLTHDHLIESGQNLIVFRKNYYRGFFTTVIGLAIWYSGSSNEEKLIRFAGAGISIIGELMMLLSFNEVGEAGEQLINAGEKLEKEQSED